MYGQQLSLIDRLSGKLKGGAKHGTLKKENPQGFQRIIWQASKKLQQQCTRIVLWLVLIASCYLFYLLFFSDVQNPYVRTQFGCPVHQEVYKKIHDVVMKNGELWQQRDASNQGGEIDVLEFGVWQGSFLSSQFPNYRSLYYTDVHDPWCPQGGGDFTFDQFDSKHYAPADFVVSINAFSAVPDINRFIEHVLGVTKKNGLAIVVEDPYFFGQYGHRLQGLWLNQLLRQSKCAMVFARNNHSGIVEEFFQLTSSVDDISKKVQSLLGDCIEAASTLKYFLEEQLQRRYPLEVLVQELIKTNQVEIQVHKVYKHIEGRSLFAFNSLHQQFQEEIDKQFKHITYTPDAVLLLLRKLSS
eukprot:TRINITY_DN10152_c0_g1_i5.p2 TRINITY_DN10152_c0_g1~~TRINITY_DN10152_c0_g1_i5.p2  ORF type:complete len:356 (-),score=20.00 TRINITY_DN10152_c0_g1_i5:251-1318(-)